MGNASKNFDMEEFACPHCKANQIDPRLIMVLQQIRDDVGVPLVISSGYRCAEHNKAVGGVDSSSHTIGLAVDIRCGSGGMRFKIIRAALRYGISRIGVSGSFIHLDIDKKKPQDVVWTY